MPNLLQSQNELHLLPPQPDTQRLPQQLPLPTNLPIIHLPQQHNKHLHTLQITLPQMHWIDLMYQLHKWQVPVWK